MVTTRMSRPPFHADQVGSLLRPKELHDARAAAKAGKLAPPELKAIEDRAIAQAVKKQEAVGLQAVTDGEFRRDFWHLDFLKQLDGIELTRPVAGAVTRNALDEGVLVNAIGDRTLRLVPPLVISDEEIDEAVRRLHRAMARAHVDLPA